ncbi:MAG: (5-formylfuran-3-yl)methyl phosphate synthase [Methanoregula sp.]|uniref:(5-formylfuran-3-yl)methyl phosphate synthase n=1 Tax=Methanoregula sp. TaxID=2052170 RepID=UPI0025ED3F7B|nr:(5-formylfuran-3-yl)methyl phosphate synthase [Methanoregula sp.]MCK9630232.1 (5-formylfuran-3-yl)methyl phosphate synthase [Methanoregula sp.]
MQLLVSPSSLNEAKDSVAADIIDVKKPSEGSLGANFPWVIREIKEFAQKPVSAAIGDFDYKPGGASLAAYGAACAGADYVKIGLAFDGKDKAREVISAVVKAVKDPFPKKYVVIAAYSDYERMHTISPFDVAPIAAECEADFAMVDTGIKDRQSTFAFMDENALRSFTEGNRKLGLGTALAGALKFEDIDALRRIDPDIIGVRGMVCGGDRNATVREDLIRKALAMIR